MHDISLIVATLGERPEDLCCLLRSLVPQAEYLREVIIVDQNPDLLRIPARLTQFEGTLPIRYTRSPRGLSRARNHGLPLATGKIVAFPDDDCLYPQGLLPWVVNWFAAHEPYDILAVGVKDAAGVASGNRWPQNRCDIKPFNAFRTTFSSSLFLKRDIALTERFDLQLGVGSGTRYGSGEETDYVLRLIRAGAMARFDRTQYIVHPRRDMLSGTGTEARALSYGFGMGHLMRIYLPPTLWMAFLGYNLVRAGWALGCGNTKGAGLCLAQSKGLWKGYREPAVAIAASAALGAGDAPPVSS